MDAGNGLLSSPTENIINLFYLSCLDETFAQDKNQKTFELRLFDALILLIKKLQLVTACPGWCFINSLQVVFEKTIFHNHGSFKRLKTTLAGARLK